MQLEMLTLPYDFELEYFQWRKNNVMQFEKLVSLLKSLGKTKITIMHEILDSEKNGTVQNTFVDNFKRSSDVVLSDPFMYFRKFYIPAWYEHDVFNISVLNNFDFNSFSEVTSNIVSVFRQFLLNDAKVKAYVSGGLELLINIVSCGIAKKLNISDFQLPPTESFELNLMKDVFNAKKNMEIEQFAKIYFYGDKEAANIEIKKQNNSLFEAFLYGLEKSRCEKKQKYEQYLDCMLAPLESQNKLEVLQDIRLLNRLMYWAGYEEPYKRYTIEYGVIDYIFREWIFQQLKSNNLLSDEWQKNHSV